MAITKKKARTILTHGEIGGVPLTEKQKVHSVENPCSRIFNIKLKTTKYVPWGKIMGVFYSVFGETIILDSSMTGQTYDVELKIYELGKGTK